MTWETTHQIQGATNAQAASTGFLFGSGSSPTENMEPAGNLALLGGRRASDPMPEGVKPPSRPEFFALIAMARQIRRDVEMLERAIERLGQSEGGHWEEYAALFEDGVPHDGSTWRYDDQDDDDDMSAF
jgi:hypothetical protein